MSVIPAPWKLKEKVPGQPGVHMSSRLIWAIEKYPLTTTTTTTEKSFKGGDSKVGFILGVIFPMLLQAEA